MSISAAPGLPPGPGPTPGVARRLACLVYEGVLLFGVLMAAGALYSILTQQRHALNGRAGMQAFVFIALAIYFSWFWSHGGQTVAMKAWHIRLVMPDGTPVPQRRALARYLASWVWFLPALAGVSATEVREGWQIFGAIAAGILVYAALAWLRRDRQFWHDALCGTRLVTWRPASPAQAKSAT
jgi:uncharacterized RDD family membrane protein YckC